MRVGQQKTLTHIMKKGKKSSFVWEDGYRLIANLLDK